LSVATVSKALNGRGDVSKETTNAVKAIADKLGYSSNALATSLLSGSSNIVALVTPEVESQYNLQLLRGIAGAIQEQRLELIVSFATAGGAAIACQTHRQRGLVRGVILISPAIEEADAVEHIAASGFPLAIINPTRKLRGVPSIEPDIQNGIAEATTHLLTEGHRCLGIIVGDRRAAFGQARLAGYKKALAAFDIPYDEAMVLDMRGPHDDKAGEAAAIRLIASNPSPTGIICYNDWMAYGVIKALERQGLAIPADISVVGFDDLPTSVFFGPGLTTVAYSADELGRLAVACFTGLKPPETAVVAAHALIRGSSGPPPRRP
jgi:LacI family transcriptional regulator